MNEVQGIASLQRVKTSYLSKAQKLGQAWGAKKSSWPSKKR